MPTTAPTMPTKPKVDFQGAVLVFGDRAYAKGPGGTLLVCPASHWLQDGTDTLHIGQPVPFHPNLCGPRQMAMFTMILQALELAETSTL